MLWINGQNNKIQRVFTLNDPTTGHYIIMNIITIMQQQQQESDSILSLYNSPMYNPDWDDVV